MSIQDEIACVEARIAALDLSVAWVCRRAGVERATWSHWKSGFRCPMKSTWDRVIDAVQRAEEAFGK